MNSNSEPILAAPGAGLPKLELAIVRLLFSLSRWTGNRDSFTAHFQRERAAIRRLLRSCDADSGARRILIRRPICLEDSSRYWSVWMTLDHLRIVHREFLRFILSLTSGKIPEVTASTAAVKPSPHVAAGIVPDYEQSCDDLLTGIAAAGNLKTTLRFAHPWFGPLDAAGWHALAGGHMAIHRKQIERILEGLPKTLHESAKVQRPAESVPVIGRSGS